MEEVIIFIQSNKKKNRKYRKKQKAVMGCQIVWPFYTSYAYSKKMKALFIKLGYLPF